MQVRDLLLQLRYARLQFISLPLILPAEFLSLHGAIGSREHRQLRLQKTFFLQILESPVHDRRGIRAHDVRSRELRLAYHAVPVRLIRVRGQVTLQTSCAIMVRLLI